MIESKHEKYKKLHFDIGTAWYLFVKRVFDIIVSALALLCLSPIYLIIALIDHLSKLNRGPVLYGQVRMGFHGQKFKMYKFRSMVVNADEELHADKKLYAEYVRNNFKLPPDEDPRITKLGRFLRRSSIDEIPQFINIFKGDMSLVGPRPVVEDELKEYDSKKLLSVKPGAMGLWQASGRSKVGYPRRAEIEMHYIDEACLTVDLKIILANFVDIFKENGAY